MSKSKKQPKPAVDSITAADVQPTPKSSATQQGSKALRAVFAITGTVIALALIAVIAYFVYEYKYTDKVYAGVSVAGQAVGGENFQTVNQILADYKADLIENGLRFNYNGETITIPVQTTIVTEDDETDSTEEDAEENAAEDIEETTDEAEADTVELVEINVAATVQAAFAVGRSEDAVKNAQEKLTAFSAGEEIPLVYTINRASLLEQLKAEFAEEVTPYEDAKLAVDGDHVTVTPSTDGNDFDWDTILNTVETNIAQLKAVDLDLTLTAQAAPVTTADAEAKVAEAEAVLAAAPLSLTHEDDTYTIERDEVGTWLEVANVDRTPTLQFNDDAMRASLAVVAGEIDVPVQEGKFSLDIVDGTVKLTQFSDGQDGLGVNVEKAMEDLRDVVLKNHESTIELSVETTQPRATPNTLEDLGIKELLGTGTTNFAGSPSNRILNIKKGADLLNGLLIAPGETFSLLDVLKPIDIEHGWYSELVIKGDKLEKEAGGGLCQVGSTAFRAAMLSGLPIVERRNHSWAISYYAYKGLAGVDATIYDPSPDFKFKNDTDHYILWRSRIEGSNIYFELWGTSDGRKGSFTDPINYNYVSPGATVETLDPTLPPGTRNCDGHAFTGVTAEFDYIVEHPDGTTSTETFTSVYKARPQLCLVGPDAPAETTEDTETETDTNTNTNTSNSNTNSSTNTNTNTNSNTNKNNNKNKNN